MCCLKPHKSSIAILALLFLCSILTPDILFARGGGHGGGHSGGGHRSSTSHSSGGHSSGKHSSSGHSSGKKSGKSYSTGGHRGSKKAPGAKRDSHGKIARSEKAKKDFMKQSGYPNGRPGYVVDHIVPLKRGGSDSPGNMQWQTKGAAKAKDKVE